MQMPVNTRRGSGSGGSHGNEDERAPTPPPPPPPAAEQLFAQFLGSLAEYILVLRVYLLLVADGNVYHGYCKSCLHPAVDDE